MAATAETLERMTDELVRAGFLPRLPWWLRQFRRYFAARVRRLAARVGRGGAKSTNIVDLAINEVLFGDFDVPIGEVHYFAFVSQNKSEAGQRLRQIEARLRALGVPFESRGDEIVLPELRRGFRVFACQIGAVSGFRCLGFAADELAKWTNADHSANPAPEVVASLRAMTVTHPGAREFFVSSPLGTSDLHYEIIEQGDSAEQMVAIAATWEANNTITEEQTRSIEKDKKIWRREYAAEPQASASSALDPDAVKRMFEPRDPPEARGTRIIVIDPSSGKKDGWTWTTVGWAYPKEGPSYLLFDLMDGVEGNFFDTLSSADLVKRIAELAKREGIDEVHSDQREAYALRSAFADHDLGFIVHDWTATSKPEAVEKLRRWMAEGRIALPAHEKLEKELLAFEEKITPSGAFTFGARGSGHDDYVALLLTGTMALANRDHAPEQPPKPGTDAWTRMRATVQMDAHERREVEQFAKREARSSRLHKQFGLQNPTDSENWRRLIGR